MLEPAESFRLYAEIRREVFLRHALQELRILMYEVEKAFPGCMPDHIHLPFVFDHHREGDYEPSKPFHLMAAAIHLIKIFV